MNYPEDVNKINYCSFSFKSSIILLLLLFPIIKTSGQDSAISGLKKESRDPERAVNITALQAGSHHYRNGNPGLEANFKLFSTLCMKAAVARPRPDLICFPEYAISGWSYPPEKVINSIAESIPGRGYWYNRYVNLARETGIPLLGWLVESDGGKLYNTLFMLNAKGEYLGKYRKVQANLGEQTWWGWSQGEQFAIINLDGVKYGFSICADMDFPETVRCAELLGADVLLHGSIADDQGHLIPARAYDSKLPIVATIFQGGSYAVDGEGKLLGKLNPIDSGWITFQIHPFANHYGNKYGGIWDIKKGMENLRNVDAYAILTSPSTRPPWTEVFMDREGKPQTKEQLIKRFNGRYDANDPDVTAKKELNKGTFEKWQCIEIELTGPSSDGTSDPNPFDIEADVSFISPGGKEYLVPAFYNGDGNGGLKGNVWKVRFSADETGVWHYNCKSSSKLLKENNGTFSIIPGTTNAPGLYKWGRLETAGTSSNNIRYLKFREGPYWLKAGCDDPENFLGKISTYNTNIKRKAAIDYLSSRGINSLYIMTNTIDGDGKDVWPWLGENEKVAKENSIGSVRFNIKKLEEWNELFTYMQSKGMVVYIVLEDDSGWKGYDHARYYREIIARFGYLPGLIFNFNEEYNENYTLTEALELVKLLKKTDPFDHPCGIHNVNQPDFNYLQASQIDFSSIQTGNPGNKVAPGPTEYHNLVLSWIKKCRELSVRTLMVGIDEGRPEEDRKMWWSTYLSGGVWEAHVLEPYDRPMEAWDKVWTQLGGTRKFMESIPFWVMHPDSLLIKDGKGFCLNHENSEYAIYFPEGGPATIELPKGNEYRVSWWNPESSYEENFQNEYTIKGGKRKIIPPGAGDWAARIVITK